MLNTYVKRVFIFVCLLQGNFIDSDFIIPVLWNLYLGVCLVHREKMLICAFGWHFKTYSSWKIAKCSVAIYINLIHCLYSCLSLNSKLIKTWKPGFNPGLFFHLPWKFSWWPENFGECNLLSQAREWWEAGSEEAVANKGKHIFLNLHSLFCSSVWRKFLAWV